MTEQQRFDLYVLTPTADLIKAAELVLVEQHQRLHQLGFRYTADYLNSPQAFAIDPVQLPLQAGEVALDCQGGMPGFLDDYLPDDWGRKVLAQLAFYREQRKFNPHSAIETLSLLSGTRIGAVAITPQHQQPAFGLGAPLSALKEAERAAQLVDQPAHYSDHLDELSLLYLANNGTGVGGARPKTLLQDQGKAYLAKFNRLHTDPYDNARVELACLKMAKAAGLHCYDGHIEPGINGRDVLLLDRFDIVPNTLGRHHLITVNALLKEPHTQADRGGVFRYDDIAALVRKLSSQPEQDLPQLLAMMLFNRGINNIDDHERNFSFMDDGDGGFCLSPAYDMVPSMTRGAYHVAGYQYSPSPPSPAEVLKAPTKLLGLPKATVASVAEHVQQALRQWPTYAEAAGVDEEEAARVGRCFSAMATTTPLS